MYLRTLLASLLALRGGADIRNLRIVNVRCDCLLTLAEAISQRGVARDFLLEVEVEDFWSPLVRSEERCGNMREEDDQGGECEKDFR